jgi:hypothetical protein
VNRSVSSSIKGKFGGIIKNTVGADHIMQFGDHLGSKIQVAARSLLRYWIVHELGLTATELANT